jgi:hypothetical protein
MTKSQVIDFPLAEQTNEIPPDPRWQPYDGDRPLRECAQTDFEGAAELVDLIETPDEREVIRAALAASFAGEEKGRFWAGLSKEQKGRLKR